MDQFLAATPVPVPDVFRDDPASNDNSINGVLQDGWSSDDDEHNIDSIEEVKLPLDISVDVDINSMCQTGVIQRCTLLKSLIMDIYRTILGLLIRHVISCTAFTTMRRSFAIRF